MFSLNWIQFPFPRFGLTSTDVILHTDVFWSAAEKKCMNKYRSNDYSNYYHSSLIFIPPSASAGFIFTSTRRSVFLYFHLPPCLQLLHVCLCRPPVQQIPSLSLCSQLDRDTSTLRWASRKPSSLLTGRLHPCISWFLFLSDPPHPRSLL